MLKQEKVNKINSVQRNYNTGLGGIVIDKKKSSSRGITSRQKLLRISKKMHGDNYETSLSREKYVSKNISVFSYKSDFNNNRDFSQKDQSRRNEKSRDKNNDSVLSRGMSLTKNQFRGNPLKKRLRFSSRDEQDFAERFKEERHKRSRSVKMFGNIEKSEMKNKQEYGKFDNSNRKRRHKSVAIGKKISNFLVKRRKGRFLEGF